MSKWNKAKNYMAASGLVCTMIAAAVALPGYYSKFEDKKYLDKVTVIDQPNSALSYDYNSSLESKLEILSQPDKDDVKFEPTIQSTENLVNDKTMIKGIVEEIKILEESGLIWPVSQYPYKDYFAYAQLYSVENVSNPQNPNKNVLFWYMRFTDYSTFDFCFCADAYNYKIYACDFAMEDIAEEFKIRSRIGEDQDQGIESIGKKNKETEAEVLTPWKESKAYYEADGSWPVSTDELCDRYALSFPSMEMLVGKYWYSRPVGDKNISAVTYGILGMARWMRRVARAGI